MNHYKNLITLGTFILVMLMGEMVLGQASVPESFPQFYKEGHRGGRGLMPENTIPAMKKALERGANVLEMDVYLTADDQVLVAHDPFVNIQISQLAGVGDIKAQDARRYVWHQMNYEDIKKIDVGLKPHKLFPTQQNLPAYMPLLGELIDSVEAYVRQNQLNKPVYNIELKTSPSNEAKRFNAPHAQLVDAVLKVVNQCNIGNRFYIQSFDMRPLQYLHRQYPQVIVAFLADQKRSLQENIEALGFTPSIYSPNFNVVNKELIEECRSKGIQIIPWTVNNKKIMRSLINLGVNGIITDNPHFFADLGL